MENKISHAIEGLRASLDQVVYQFSETHLAQEGKPHAFIYFLTITNLSDRTIQLQGRKWVLKGESGNVHIIEGEEIVGQMPILDPGEDFSYNSYHAVSEYTEALGALYGVDEFDDPIHVEIPSFELEIPEGGDFN